MVFQSVMAFHTIKIVVQIHVVRNEMWGHQIQMSGLDFKFQIAALKHFNHIKQRGGGKKQAATDLSR